MKVKKLIAELKKMPGNLEVYANAHDNAEYEIAGNTTGVRHMNKELLREEYNLDSFLFGSDKDCFEANPKEWVIITG